MNIAVFGGTFNPFHIGHEQMLKAVCNLDFIDKVLVIPDYIPPHKETDYLASDDDRLNMCRLVCGRYNKAVVSSVEIDRKGKSYTYLTVIELIRLYPDDDFYFVLGGDMVNILDKWYKWKELTRLIRFLAFSRNDKNEFESDVERMKKLGADITVIDEVIPDVSSTDFRKNLDKTLLPADVYDYIAEKGIYNG